MLVRRGNARHVAGTSYGRLTFVLICDGGDGGSGVIRVILICRVVMMRSTC